MGGPPHELESNASSPFVLASYDAEMKRRVQNQLKKNIVKGFVIYAINARYRLLGVLIEDYHDGII